MICLVSESSRAKKGPEDKMFGSDEHRLALYVLHELGVVPEHFETRTLFNEDCPGIPQVSFFEYKTSYYCLPISSYSYFFTISDNYRLLDDDILSSNFMCENFRVNFTSGWTYSLGTETLLPLSTLLPGNLRRWFSGKPTH